MLFHKLWSFENFPIETWWLVVLMKSGYQGVFVYQRGVFMHLIGCPPIHSQFQNHFIVVPWRRRQYWKWSGNFLMSLMRSTRFVSYAWCVCSSWLNYLWWRRFLLNTDAVLSGEERASDMGFFISIVTQHEVFLVLEGANHMKEEKRNTKQFQNTIIEIILAPKSWIIKRVLI